jgi:hypothetical protein
VASSIAARCRRFRRAETIETIRNTPVERTVMSDGDDSDDESTPTVQLGDGRAVEGAPIARVAARLAWPQRKSDILEKFGDTDIRTPDGPQSLATILESVDDTYFDRRQTFVAAVRDVIGREPVATE